MHASVSVSATTTTANLGHPYEETEHPKKQKHPIRLIPEPARERKGRQRAVEGSSDGETHLEKDQDLPSARACEHGEIDNEEEETEGRGGGASSASLFLLCFLACVTGYQRKKNKEKRGGGRGREK